MMSHPLSPVSLNKQPEEGGSVVTSGGISSEAGASLGLPFGASVTDYGVNYRIWSPGQQSLVIEIKPEKDGSDRELVTTREADGYHCVTDPAGLAGDAYRIRLDNGFYYADPVSRAQQSSVTGYSLVVDPHSYPWQDGEWQRPAFRDLVIYELHVGTFTQEGTFRAVISKLPLLKELGVTALELMPIGDFPGGRNWGYDGVLIYAPARVYGSPDDLRALVDAAHQHGLAVILDVVYNHMGPDGCCLGALASEYYHPTRETPWGKSFNFDGPQCKPVREFFACNPVYWMHEFHIDGVRLDATHAIQDESPRHILAEISERVHALGGYVIAEDERNEVRLIEPPESGGFGLDAVWADDFHHSVRVSQTSERYGYLQNFRGTLEETVDTLRSGWRFRGQVTTKEGTLKGTECGHVAPAHLIHCINNHDQTGNQAFGIRLCNTLPPASNRAISMLLCLSPYTPMLFMGQEWSAHTPFMFFTDHNAELGKLITEGRRKEFSEFPEFADEALREEIPDPQAESTFIDSKLDWDELQLPSHAGVRELYSQCLKIRNDNAAFRPLDRDSWEVGHLRPGVGYIRFDDPVTPYIMIFHLWPNGDLIEVELDKLPFPSPDFKAELLLSSDDARFGGSGTLPLPDAPSYIFRDAEALLFRGTR